MRVLTRNTPYIVSTALLLLTFFVNAPVYAHESVDDCGFDQLSQRRREFKETWLREEVDMPAFNEAFMQKVFSDLYSIEASRNVLYFHVENAVLKSLNDKVFKDKELSAATLNLYRQFFFDELKRDRLLVAHLGRQEDGNLYADFKSIRLRLPYSAPEDFERIQDSLARLHVRVAARFGHEIKSRPELRELYEGRPGLIADPINWNLAGIGHSAPEASLQARRSRRPQPGQERVAGEALVPRLFDQRAAVEVASQIDEIESLRKNLAGIWKDPRIFEEGVPTVDLLDILRRAQGDLNIKTHGEYRHFVRQRMSWRWDQRPTDEQIDDLQRYYHLANELAPSIFIKDREPIALAPLKNATHGVISFDVGGQNSRNMRETMESLKTTSEICEPLPSVPRFKVDQAQKMMFAGQVKESELFDESKNVLKASIQAVHLHGRGTNIEESEDTWSGSGDDATFLPTQPVSLSGQKSLLRALRDRWVPPSRFRVTFQPQDYQDDNRRLEERDRFRLVSEAENIEKSLRDFMEMSDTHAVPYEELKDTIFAIRSRPRSDGRVGIDVIYAKGKSSHHQGRLWEQNIRAALKGNLPPGYHLEKIYDADVEGP